MADENHNSENNSPENNKESAKDKWREIAERLAEIKKSKEVSEISNEPVNENELERKRREIADRLAAIKGKGTQNDAISDTPETTDVSKNISDSKKEKDTTDDTLDKKVEDNKVIGSDVVTPLTDIEEIESNVPTFTESIDRDIDKETEIHTITEDPELGDDFNDAELYTQPEETKTLPATPETLNIDVLEKEPDVPVFEETIDRGIDDSLEITPAEDDTEAEKTKDVEVPTFNEPVAKDNNQQEIPATTQVTEVKKTDTRNEPTTKPSINKAEVEAEEEKIKKMFLNEDQNVKNKETMKEDTNTSESEKKESEKSKKSSKTQKAKAQSQKKRPKPQDKKRTKPSARQKKEKTKKPEKTVTYYLINDEVLKNLQQQGLSNKTIINLRRIKNKKYKPKDIFLKVLQTTIGSNAVEEYGEIIVQAAEKTEKKKSNSAIIVLLIIFGLIVGIGVYFYFNRSQWNQVITEFGMKETIEKFTTSDTPETDETTKPPVTDENTKKPENDNETKPPVTKAEVSDAAVKKWGLKPPFTIISYGSFTKEQTAKQQSAKLKGLGYKAGYYWIPDYSPNSKPLFKVYVGPYKNENQANKALPTIQKLMNDAYIISY